MSPSRTDTLQAASIFHQSVMADKDGAACRPACPDLKISNILNARVEDELNCSSEISTKTINCQQQSLVKKRDRTSQDYELDKESLERSYQLEVSIIRLHLTGSRQVNRLEKLKRENAAKLKELELSHPAAENLIQHKVDNQRSEVSGTMAATQAQCSASSRKVAYLHPEENHATADSRSTSKSTEGTSPAEMELDGGGASSRNNQDAVIWNTFLKEIDLGKEIIRDSKNDKMHGLNPQVLSPRSNAAPHETNACLRVEVSQSSDFRKASGNASGGSGCHSMTLCSNEDRNCDVSEVFVSPEATRAVLGNTSPSHCLEGMVSENRKSDACDDAQIRDVNREVTSESIPVSSAPGCSPELPPISTNKDGSGSDREQQNNLREAEPEGPNSLNHIFSDSGVDQTQLPQICEDAYPPTSPQDITLADGVGTHLQPDTLTSPQVEMHTLAVPNSHMAATQTSSQPMTHSVTDSLGTSGGRVGSSQLFGMVSPQPLVQGAAEMPSPNPLENELEKIKREIVHNDQTYVDLNVRLNSERDQEIQETVARIRARYDLELKEADAAYKLKRNALDSYKDKVYMHIQLVEALRKIPSGLQLQQADAPVNAPQQSLDVLSSAGGSLAPPVCASSRRLPSNPSPSRAATPICPQSTTRPVVMNSEFRTSALCPVNPASPHFSDISSTPLINPIPPARSITVPSSTAPPVAGCTIPLVGARAPPPNLQCFRPQAGPILPQPYRQVNLPPEAVRRWVRDSVPRSSSSADIVSLSDDE
ncbi:hypothetical protein MLD38_009591 [Melastoma candidum]|uniref:Uncharacterized protein n=1 Tax=Melastoma candidum TaxID=119954 RepID=A0ACB9RZB8_9MYRT|nr:hypothetical protein MLD38_009591 [Melastoma candidum]